MIELANATALAGGRARMVYQHPERDDLLIKLIQSTIVREKEERRFDGRKFRRRIGRYVSFSREIHEFLSIRAQSGRHADMIERIVGFAETDLGLGLVVEKLTAADGGLAPTLQQIAARKPFDESIWDLVDEFRAGVDEFNVILGELHTGNIVCAGDPGQGRRLVLIDSYGEKLLIPVLTISRRLNRYRNAKLFRRLAAQIARQAEGASIR